MMFSWTINKLKIMDFFSTFKWKTFKSRVQWNYNAHKFFEQQICYNLNTQIILSIIATNLNNLLSLLNKSTVNYISISCNEEWLSIKIGFLYKHFECIVDFKIPLLFYSMFRFWGSYKFLTNIKNTYVSLKDYFLSNPL
jgi:hypothetical protein